MCTCNKRLLVSAVAFLVKIKIGKTVILVSHFKVMFCYHPIQVVNPSKYISLVHRDPYLISVPCGNCAGCQQSLSNQWLYRTWQECQDIVSYNGNSYVYFDSLSYSDRYLPYMSDIIPDLPHVSCFRPIDLRNFLQTLALRLKRRYKSIFRYFVSSEYGHDNVYVSDSGRIRKGTIRPHYHLLFFVYGDISPLQLSSEIADVWKFGRTDGYPYKRASYVYSHNTIDNTSLPFSYLRASSYVIKYVQKSCLFDDKLNKRLNNAMFKIASHYDDGWLNSVHAKRVRSKLKRHVNQFHRQSQQFGASGLASLDLKQLFRDGCLFMPSIKGVKMPISLPTYFKRKLFYDLVVVDGSRVWQLNDLGFEYKKYRKPYLLQTLSEQFYSVSLSFNLGFSFSQCQDLAVYVYNYQGRINGDFDPVPIIDKLKHVSLFNYVTLSDKEHLSHVGVVNRFLGNNTIGYNVDSLPPSYSISDFIGKYLIIDNEKEKQLSSIYYHLSQLSDRKQSAFALKQRLTQVYKIARGIAP